MTWPTAAAPLVKIIDMGLVRSTRQVDNNGVTRDGQAMGTPDFMAPEQALDAQQADIRADIYSLGCTLFRMITGEVPFKGINAVKVLLVRCQNEPPQLVDKVPDIDPAINKIVLKMMAREPDDRYQTPIEAAEALAAVAEVPIQDDLKSLIDAADSMASKKTLQPVDVNLDQFLNALAGGDADLISESSYDIATPPSEFIVTAPDFGPAATPAMGSRISSSRSFGSRTSAGRSAVRSKGRGKLLAIGLCSAAMLAIVGGLWAINRRPKTPTVNATRTTPPTVVTEDQGAEEEPEVTPPRSVLSAMDSYRGNTTRTISFSVRPDDFLNADDQVVYKIDNADNAEAKVDPSTGQFQWSPDSSTPAGDYNFTVSARTVEDEVIDEPVSFVVKLTSQYSITIGEISDQTVEAGQTARVVIPYSGPPGQAIVAHITCDTIDGFQMPIRSRIFTWETSPKHVGTHTFKVQILSRDDKETVALSDFNITVVAPKQPLAIEVAEQTATVGQPFVLQAKTAAGRIDPAKTIFRLNSGPGGMVLDASQKQIEWTPAADDVGTHKVRINLRPTSAPDQLVAIAEFEIVVMPAEKVSSSSIPSAEEVAAAREKIESIYKRELSGARSLIARRELSMKLFDLGTETQGAQSYVLLEMARDMAVRGRDYLAAIHCIRELQADFGVDASVLIAESLKGLRTREIDATDRQLFPELLCQQIGEAIKDQNWEAADEFIKQIRSIATIERDNDLRTVVNRMSELATAMQPQDQIPPDQTTADLAKNELHELLDKFAFQPIFMTQSRFTFLNHSTGDIPDRGRSLWVHKNGRMSLKSESPVTSGYLDQANQFTNYVLRMDLGPSSNTGKLIIGALPENGQVQAFEIDLSNNQFGVVRPTGSADVIARPKNPVSRTPNRWDHIEVEVKDATMILRFNGRVIVETALSRAAVGLIGVDVQLPGKNSRFHVRNVRVKSL